MLDYLINLMYVNRPKNKLNRSLGLFALSVIGVSGTVGGGIFVLIGPGAAIAGEYLPISFIVGGVLALLGSLLYAELGTTIPRSGSSIELVFNTTRKRYYPFMFSWLVLLGDVSYLTINALGVAFYANLFIPINPMLIALGAIGLAVAVNMRNITSTGKAEMLIVSVLVLLLLTFVALGVGSREFAFGVGEFASQMPFEILPILAAVSVVFSTYIGYEYIASIAEEAKEPAKNIPRALVLSVLAAMVLFVSVSFTAVNLVGADAIAGSGSPLLLAAEQLGSLGVYVVLPAALIATMGSLLASTLVSSRRIYALSRQGYFERAFSPLNANDVPHRSVLAVAILAVFLLLTNSIAFVAYISSTVYLVVMIVIALSLLRFRKQRPYLERPFRAPLFPWLPLFLIALSALILVFVGLISLLVTVLWLLLGYFVYMARHITPQSLYLMTWGAMLFLLMVGVVSVSLLLL